MAPENKFLNKMPGLVRKGEVEPVAAYLAGIDALAPLHISEKRALLKDCGEIMGSALADHYSKQYYWLASCFMVNPDILPAIAPHLIEEVVAVLPGSKFPKTKSYLERHQAPTQAEGWASRNLPQQLILIAEAVISLNDTDREDAFSDGFRFLSADIQDKTVYEAVIQENPSLVKFLREAIHKGPLVPAEGPKDGNPPTPES